MKTLKRHMKKKQAKAFKELEYFREGRKTHPVMDDIYWILIYFQSIYFGGIYVIRGISFLVLEKTHKMNEYP